MRINLRTRYEVLERSNFACFYCGVAAQQGVVQLQVEHVVPRARGGTDAPTNLVAACQGCNLGKGTLMPQQSLIEQARDLYIAWAGSSDSALCERCGRVYRLEVDEEPSGECWTCIRAWCDGYSIGKAKSA